MKIEMEREEIIAAITETVNAKFGAKWKTTTSDYNWPRSVEFIPDTPEQTAKEEAEKAETARILAEWEAKKNAVPEPAQEIKDA